MGSQAKVTSVEALEAFRVNLILYLNKMRPVLEEVSDEVLRTRAWIESERRVYWESQVRKLTQKWQEAQQAIFSASLSNLREVSSAERMTVQKARRALDVAEAKLALTKKWARNFDSMVMPIARNLEKLQSVLNSNVPDAIVYLAKSVQTLESYQDISSAAAPTPAPSETSAVNPEEPKP